MAKNRTLKNGTVVSDKMTQNFVEGSGITLTVTDDGAKANIQIDASAAATTYATTAELADVASSESAGVSTTVPRGDHVHAHEAAHINHDTTWAAKGDLIVATADNTGAVQSIGTNFHDSLVPNSAKTNGLEWSMPRNPMRPSGSLYETIPRHSQHKGSGAALMVSGTVLMSAIALPAGLTIASISYVSGSQALAVGTHQVFGLYDSSRNLLRSTTDDTNTAWNANSVKTLSLTSSYATTTSGMYYLAILVTANTVPSLCYHEQFNTLTGLAPITTGTSSTSQTAMPDPAGAITAQGYTAYAYVS